MQPEGSAYPPILDMHTIDGPLSVDGAGGRITLMPFEVRHGTIDAGRNSIARHNHRSTLRACRAWGLLSIRPIIGGSEVDPELEQSRRNLNPGPDDSRAYLSAQRPVEGTGFRGQF